MPSTVLTGVVTDELLPLASSFQWPPRPFWLLVGADVIIAIALVVVALYLLLKFLSYPTPAIRRFALLSAAFLFFSGVMHLVSVVVMWAPLNWWMLGIAKTVVVGCLILAAGYGIRALPYLFTLKCQQEYEDQLQERTERLASVNASLASEVETRTKAEAAVRANEEKIQERLADSQTRERHLRTLIDALPARVSYVDSEQCFQFVNAAYSSAFGRSRLDFVGSKVSEVLDARTYQAVSDYIEAALAGEAQAFPLSMPMADGLHYVDVNYVPDRGVDGLVRGIFELVVDTTDRQRAAEELAAHRFRLEQSNTELQQFVSVASHDLREPLRTINSYLDLLRMRFGDNLGKEAVAFVDVATNAAERMGKLISGLVDFCRLDSDGGEARPVSLDRTLDQVLVDLRQVIAESGADIIRDPLPIVLVDPVQGRQLLQNLISNSIKFRSESAPEIHIGCIAQGSEWVISVRDNGIGIYPRFRDRVFDLFQRLHPRGEFTGTGLGLALCRRIVERNGGKIWLGSESGLGSVFYFSLPGADSRSSVTQISPIDSELGVK